MATVHFDQDRWNYLQDTYMQWWNGELGRPIVPVVVDVPDDSLPRPGIPPLNQAVFADLSITPEQIVSRIEFDLCQRRWFGDAFPWVNFNCSGPGILAAMIGAELFNEPGEGRTWFRPRRDQPIADIHFELDRNSVWLRRIKDISGLILERFDGLVLVGLPDLGGNLDILSTFRPSEKLLLDLYDYPDEVKRLTWEAHQAWFRAVDEINSVLQPVNPGYTGWGGIYSTVPTYMLQCDFAYMIGPGMFDEFVKPELTATCQRLGHPFYHLDGKGQLPHLPSLLTIEDLHGVQWVPGTGSAPPREWPEVYGQILDAGKRTQVIGGLDELDALVDRLGTGRGMQMQQIHVDSADEAERRLARYGIEA